MNPDELKRDITALAKGSRTAARGTSPEPRTYGAKEIMLRVGDDYLPILRAVDHEGQESMQTANVTHAGWHDPQTTRRMAGLLEVLADLLPELRHGHNSATGARCEALEPDTAKRCTCGRDDTMNRVRALLEA